MFNLITCVFLPIEDPTLYHTCIHVVAFDVDNACMDVFHLRF